MPNTNNVVKFTLFAFSDSKSVVLRVSTDNTLKNPTTYSYALNHNTDALDLKLFSSPFGIPSINSTIVRKDISFSNYHNLNYSDKEVLLQQSLLSAHAYKSFSAIFPIKTKEYLIPFTYEKLLNKRFVDVNGQKTEIIRCKIFEELPFYSSNKEENGIYSHTIDLIKTLELEKRFNHLFVDKKINLMEGIILGETAIEKRYNERPWFLEENHPYEFIFKENLYPYYREYGSLLVNKLSEFISTTNYLHSHPEFKLLNLGGLIPLNNNKTFDSTIIQYKNSTNTTCVVDNYNPKSWSTHIEKVYNRKKEALGVQHPEGKVLVTTSFADPQYYKNIPSYDLVTLEENQKFITAFFTHKHTDIRIEIEKMHEEYITANETFTKSEKVMVSHKNFKDFCDYIHKDN